MDSPKVIGNQRLLNHHSLYKMKTPPWKETFRMKCFQRLKSSRGRLVDKFRGIGVESDELVDALMTEDIRSLSIQPGHLKLNQLECEEVDEFLSILQEIQKELMEEEKKWIEEYSSLSETNSLESALDWLQKEEVICPLCQRNPLHQNVSVIFCACGMRIDTKQDGLTLSHLKENLHMGLTEHEEICHETPSFSQIHFGDANNIVLTCGACNFMFIII
ncbi:RPA-interacting protein B isoform X2 [Parasteatoda tepidariorum]|nr:RPA-interacting protein B isoform X2 [Parasteatoda tepidariorum]